MALFAPFFAPALVPAQPRRQCGKASPGKRTEDQANTGQDDIPIEIVHAVCLLRSRFEFQATFWGTATHLVVQKAMTS